MAQEISLYKIIKRRSLARQDTYILFLEFQKAYDVVPHGALFRELEIIGVTGHILEFI